MESAQTLSSGGGRLSGVGGSERAEGGAQRFVGDRAVRNEAPDLGEREFVAALPIVAHIVQALERHGGRRLGVQRAAEQLDQGIRSDAVEQRLS